MLYQYEFDPRKIPNYSISEAAHYLRVREGKLRDWIGGWTSRKKSHHRFFEPLIELPKPNEEEQQNPKIKRLCFMNLVEGHLLSGMFGMGLPPERVYDAIADIIPEINLPYPLAQQKFQTDGVPLLFDSLLEHRAISAQKQQEMREVIKTYLDRIERDEVGLPLRLFLFTRRPGPEDPKTVAINPHISFGRPVLTGTGIPTAILAERYKAGDSIDELAEDYNCDRLLIEEGIRCELPLVA